MNVSVGPSSAVVDPLSRCPGLPQCRWLLGILPHNSPFVDHASWHAAGSHATIYGDDGPSCTCGADAYMGDNNNVFRHLGTKAPVVVCADSDQRIGYNGETIDPNRIPRVISIDSKPVGYWISRKEFRCNRMRGVGLCWALHDTYAEARACQCQAEARGSSVAIPNLSSEDVSKLAYACDVLAVHASSDEYHTWASATAERLRSLLWELANPHQAARRRDSADEDDAGTTSR